ncbi:MAG: tRNA uridine(34) 5-carboxymethylaminomethyl modification radical SAM/GNAT enzyme Elp3 [Candidatus Bathyarchaeia archaeon]
MSEATRWIADKLLELDSPTREDVSRLKHEAARRFDLPGFPGNADILRILEEDERRELLPLLRRKSTRSLSGVKVIAVMTKPYPCPHGRCAYCPGGPTEDSPQSYTGHEPAAMRGAQNNYDPRLQVQNRMEQLRAIGHKVDKVELIIMGGTFPASPREYQRRFVWGCLDALNGSESASLEDAKNGAEVAKIRNVGMTVETRPDCISRKDINFLLNLGVTRVEMGVQTVYDDIYRLVNRGHSVDDVVKSTRLMKDSALKILYHMMPGMPGSDFDRDISSFKTIFEDPRFKPDMIKIYPTLVIEGTELYDWWKQGDYEPLMTMEAAKLVAKVKAMIPPWIRIMRVQRDIPSQYISAGVKKGNLRQIAKKILEDEGKQCRCIRCREVGHRQRAGVQPDPNRLSIQHHTYEASEGLEDFISAEDLINDVLVGFLRLRIPSPNPYRPEITSSTGLIRELHVYGEMVPVGEDDSEAWQHIGWGEKLLKEAERTAAEEYDMDRMVVMSALGTKEYYSSLGYRKDGTYVSKELK